VNRFGWTGLWGSATLASVKFHAHWARVTGWVETELGRRHLSALGWSDESEGAASAVAERRLSELGERFQKGFPERRGYLYGLERPMAEPIVERVNDARGNTVALITRNAYGALVLNTERALFIDVDFEAQQKPQGFLSSLFKRPKSPEEAALSRVERASEQFGRSAFRVYRTHAGLRLVALDYFVPGYDDHLLDVLQSFGSDPLYVKLCAAQRCFRARLTPKPWRIDLPRPAQRFPFASERAREQHARWVERYEARSREFATCRQLTTLGLGHASEVVSAILAVHDRYTLREGAPLG
jgi:hypothetical protein